MRKQNKFIKLCGYIIGILIIIAVITGLASLVKFLIEYLI